MHSIACKWGCKGPFFKALNTSLDPQKRINTFVKFMKYKYEIVIYLRGNNPVHDIPENT